MDQTQTQRYVSRFEPLALRPRLHREGFPIHYLVHQGLPPRRICTTREYRTPLSNTTSQPRGRPVAKQQSIHLTLEGYKPTPTPSHQEGVNHNLNLYQRGSKPITRSTSTKEGYNKSKGVYNKWFPVSYTHLTLPTKRIV